MLSVARPRCLTKLPRSFFITKASCACLWRTCSVTTQNRAQSLSPLARLEAMTKQQQAKMLRLTLELVRQKTARGVPLTVRETELLAECRRRYYAKPKEEIKLQADGRITVHRSMDVEPIMEAMKAYGDILGPRRNDKVAGAKMIGGIDPITAELWAKECGERIGSKPFNKFAAKRLKNDIDYRRFRVGG